MDMKIKSSIGISKTDGTDRKSVKGFTLVELIVVIAIISILVGIANLAAQGFVRNARRETANDNAHILFTGFQNILTQCEIKQDNSVISPTFTNDPTQKQIVIEFKVYNGNVQCFKNGTGTGLRGSSGFTGDMGGTTKYTDAPGGIAGVSNLPNAIAGIIDNTFEGEAKVYIDYENYEVKSVVFKPMTESNKNTTINDFTSGPNNGGLDAYGSGDWYLGFDNGGDQETAYDNHPLYGVYPFQSALT